MSGFADVLTFHQVLKAEQNSDTVVMTPQGEAFGFRYADIQTEYNRIYQLLEEKSRKYLIVDFAQLTYIDSTFIGVCLSLAKKAKLNGGRTILCGMCEEVRNLLKTAQLIENDRFTMFWTESPNRETALAELAE